MLGCSAGCLGAAEGNAARAKPDAVRDSLKADPIRERRILPIGRFYVICLAWKGLRLSLIEPTPSTGFLAEEGRRRPAAGAGTNLAQPSRSAAGCGRVGFRKQNRKTGRGRGQGLNRLRGCG